MASPATDVYLHPGDVRFAGAGVRLRTLLGSCVAITLWHPRLCIGGMCHFVVPARGQRPRGELSGRYADEAVELLLREVRGRGTEISQYEAKMFGGGAQFSHSGGVPQGNVAAGLRLLEQHGLHLAARHLGSTGSRLLIFDIATGEVWLQHQALRHLEDSA
ncbi:hypothetical protein AB0M46_15225 [Dactylosporangium sp. NPDC051485]|uniref:hypothetical protein n=1 Tax=Dactylosporangium sp. NPDC051485 TaxID=3154846 RepID=UPI003434C8ED